MCENQSPADGDNLSTGSSSDNDAAVDTLSLLSLASLNTVEAVSGAIGECKTRILQTTENTDSRKEMVNQLIKLRIRLQVSKDSENPFKLNLKSNLSSWSKKF